MAFFQFYYPKRFAFCPSDYDTGLGGTEASIVLLTKTLASLGHKVEVYNACWKEGKYDGVTWKNAWRLEENTNDEDVDVFVCVRTKSSVINVKAKKYIFWMLDDRIDGVLAFEKAYPEGVVILASEVMRNRALQAGYKGKIEKIFLPIETDKLANSMKPSSNHSVLHSSMPNRGLKELLQIWPKVHEEIPDATLYVTSGWELWGYTKEEAKDRWKEVIGTDFDKSGVVLTGVLPKGKLFELEKSVRFCVIPSKFPEMFCISAAEAEAAGRPLIVSDLEALHERVSDEMSGYLIAGSISSMDVQNQFVKKMINLLQNDDLCDKMGEVSALRAKEYNPIYVASKWFEILEV